MASRSSALGALSYDVETSFGEITTTTTIRLRPVGAITADLQHPGQKPDILRQRPNEGVPYIRMPMSGSLSFEHYLTGLGGVTSGAAPASALATLLGTVYGLTATGLATGTTATAGSTAGSVNTTAASGITAGALVRFGLKGDGAADGQWAAVSAHSTSIATLLTALPGAPAAAAVIHASRMVYPSQTPGTADTLSSVRFLYQTTGQQYLLHGCYPTAAELMINVGEVPRVRLTYAISWWEPVNSTFPSATAVQDYAAAPVAGGSMFMQAVGTATRATVVARSVSMSIALANIAENGVGGYDEHQAVTGVTRTPAPVMVDMTIDTDAAGTDTFGDIYDVSENARINRHALYSMSVGEGRSLALYWPNLTMVDKPVQFDDGGLLRRRLRFEALTGTTTTTDLTMSPWRLGMS